MKKCAREQLINEQCCHDLITVSLIFIVALLISVSKEERFQNDSLSLSIKKNKKLLLATWAFLAKKEVVSCSDSSAVVVLVNQGTVNQFKILMKLRCSHISCLHLIASPHYFTNNVRVLCLSRHFTCNIREHKCVYCGFANVLLVAETRCVLETCEPLCWSGRYF